MIIDKLLEQRAQIKKIYPKTILLFRIGDFYEAYAEDAEAMSEICYTVLTSRPTSNGRVWMTGVPHHAIDSYRKVLTEAGRYIGLVDQNIADQQFQPMFDAIEKKKNDR